MAEEVDQADLTVLVTGFGEFQDIKNNPSFEIVSLVPPMMTHKGLSIRLIAHPNPLKAAYHSLLSTIPPLLEERKPDIVVHIGLAVERDYFAIEKSAERDGYQQYPDVSRKVFTKTESKKIWAKSPEKLETAVNFDNVVAKWKKGAGKGFDVRASDDVGNYVCGFVYYLSLEHFWKRGNKEKKVVFLHVPPLTGEKELGMGKEVTLGLIRAIVEEFR